MLEERKQVRNDLNGGFEKCSYVIGRCMSRGRCVISAINQLIENDEFGQIVVKYRVEFCVERI